MQAGGEAWPKVQCRAGQEAALSVAGRRVCGKSGKVARGSLWSTANVEDGAWNLLSSCHGESPTGPRKALHGSWDSRTALRRASCREGPARLCAPGTRGTTSGLGWHCPVSSLSPGRKNKPWALLVWENLCPTPGQGLTQESPLEPGLGLRTRVRHLASHTESCWCPDAAETPQGRGESVLEKGSH